MSTKDQNREDIFNLLEGWSTPQENKSLQKRMETEPELREEYEAQQMLREEMQQMHTYLRIKTLSKEYDKAQAAAEEQEIKLTPTFNGNTKKENEKTPFVRIRRNPSFGQVYRYASALLLPVLLGGVVWLNQARIASNAKAADSIAQLEVSKQELAKSTYDLLYDKYQLETSPEKELVKPSDKAPLSATEFKQKFDNITNLTLSKEEQVQKVKQMQNLFDEFKKNNGSVTKEMKMQLGLVYLKIGEFDKGTALINEYKHEKEVK